MTNIGFTGTREGISIEQAVIITYIINEINPQKVHHGDCVGADSDFNWIVRTITPNCLRIAHPPIDEKLRAFCNVHLTMDPKPYLDRNRDIVDKCSFLIAAPKGPETQRSGTWYTIRYAKSVSKPVKIIWPDGRIEDV